MRIIEETITITKKRYDSLIRTEDKMNALEAGGVDNWENYHDSLKDFYDDEDEEDDD